MKILIVSGFLGAGKTTFIKELIRRSGTRPVIMENEYGENNLDAKELQTDKGKEMKILEFMEGCVCCTMKDSFVNSVLTIFSGLEPEFLVIEPTGVGRLSSILENLKPILHDNIELLNPVAVLAPRAYSSHMSQWPDLYSDQIRHAGIIVFSKAEQEDTALLEESVRLIRSINPDAEIISDHYTRQPDAWWRGLMNLPIDRVPDTFETSPSIDVEQLSLRHARLIHPSQLILLLEDCLRGELGQIARAKGILPVGDEMIRFDLADGLYALTGSQDQESQCVFIGKGLNRETLCQRMGTSLPEEVMVPSLLSLPQTKTRGDKNQIRLPKR